jgi:hypothetical protein
MSIFGAVPVLDELVQETDSLYCAYIYGYIWCNRTVKMTFEQSLTGISKAGNLSRSTVVKWVHWLTENGYLIDLTPDEIGSAHVYQITEKAIIDLSVTFHRRSKNGQGGVHSTDTPLSIQHTPRCTSNVHMYHDDHDDTYVKILDTWRSLGFDAQAAKSLIEKNRKNGQLEKFSDYLEGWLEADQNGLIPENWGAGMLYNKIRAGEMPPKLSRWFDDAQEALLK